MSPSPSPAKSPIATPAPAVIERELEMTPAAVSRSGPKLSLVHTVADERASGGATITELEVIAARCARLDVELVVVHAGPQPLSIRGARNVLVPPGTSVGDRRAAGAAEAAGDIVRFVGGNAFALREQLDALSRRRDGAER